MRSMSCYRTDLKWSQVGPVMPSPVDVFSLDARGLQSSKEMPLYSSFSLLSVRGLQEIHGSFVT